MPNEQVNPEVLKALSFDVYGDASKGIQYLQQFSDTPLSLTNATENDIRRILYSNNKNPAVDNLKNVYFAYTKAKAEDPTKALQAYNAIIRDISKQAKPATAAAKNSKGGSFMPFSGVKGFNNTETAYQNVAGVSNNTQDISELKLSKDKFRQLIIRAYQEMAVQRNSGNSDGWARAKGVANNIVDRYKQQNYADIAGINPLDNVTTPQQLNRLLSYSDDLISLMRAGGRLDSDIKKLLADRSTLQGMLAKKMQAPKAQKSSIQASLENGLNLLTRKE